MKYLILLKMFSCSLLIFAQNLVPRVGVEMKYLFLLLGILFCRVSTAQIDIYSGSDSIKEKTFLDRLLYIDYCKKRQSIIDLNTVPIELNYGAIGYNYFFSLNKFVRVGGRAGICYFRTKDDLPINSARNGFSYSLQGLVNFKIWRSFQSEFGFGHANLITWPTKTNTSTNADGGQFQGHHLLFYSGLNITILKKLFLRGGVEYRYTKSWNFNSSLAIGYNF